MSRAKRALALAAAMAEFGLCLTASAAGSAPGAVIANVDLAGPFQARSAWRFVATQGPQEAGVTGDMGPGQIEICLRRGQGAACDAALSATPDYPRSPGDPAWPPHYLQAAELVYPKGRAAAPLFLVRTGSELSGDGDQVVATQVLAYRPSSDSFERVYAHVTGHNNNQEVRFLTSGPLLGDIVSVEPTDNAPYGFWVTVSTLTPAYSYRQVLRYRSATHYGDGNPLAVIDSEMPAIEARLGLWRAGAPLPLPPGPCPKPRLVAMELWCR